MSIIHKHISEIFVLSVVSGTLLLFININHLLNIDGILLVAVAFISIPILLTVFSEFKINKILLLVLVFFPIILINYIYHIQNGSPVGFQDVHDHIYQYQHLFNNGIIQFSQAQAISYNSVGLYIFYKFLDIIINTDIAWLASVIPPFVNIVITLVVFLLINRLFSFRLAIITTLIFGWSDQVLLFGHEFRTQTMGTLFLFCVLLLIAIFYLNKKTKSFRKTIIMLLLFGGLVLISFVSWIFAFIIFSMILISSVIFERKKDILISPFMIIIFFLFFIFYIIYIGISLDSTVTSVVNLLENFFVNELSSPRIGQLIYGSFIQWFMYCFWGIFIISSIYYLKEIFFKKLDILKIAFFVSFVVLFLFGFILSISSGTLSTARVYIVIMILIGTVITFGIFKLFSGTKTKHNKIFIKLFTTLFIILFISTSLAKLPNYVIGETKPLREKTDIDKYNYWRLDNNDYAASSFMDSIYYNRTIHLHLLIKNYMLLKLYDKNQMPDAKSIDPTGKLINTKIQNGDIILLQDKAWGNEYALRNLLPAKNAYYEYNALYDNHDYILFMKNEE